LYNMAVRPIVKAAVLAVFGSILFIESILLFIYFPAIFHTLVLKNLPIHPKSPGYMMWLVTPLPIYVKIRLFNVTNPEDILSGSKPILQELGPYVYREHRQKVKVTFNANETVSFRQVKWYEFEPELSNGSEEDIVTSINMPALTASYVTRHASWMTQFGVNSALQSGGETVFRKYVVREVLFEGADSPILTFAKSMEGFSKTSVPFDKFGWFYKKNFTDDGRFAVFTGADDITKLGQIDFWNYVKEVSCWPKWCAKINGSNGEQFYPGRDPFEPLTIFAPDLMRSISLEYDRGVDIMGVPGNRYRSGPGLLANGTDNPHNSCFDPPGGIASGLLNISTCRFGAPAFLSQPHFLHADQSYLDAVEGLNPSVEDHSAFITINPDLGVPIKVEARFQLNVLLTNIKGIRMFSNVPTVYLPALWFEQFAVIDDATSSKVKLLLQTIPLLLGVIFPLAMLLVAIILIISAVIVFRNRMKKKIVETAAFNDRYTPMKMNTLNHAHN